MTDYVATAASLRDVAAFYPGFDSWFWLKVVPGAADGKRFVDTITRGSQVVAVAISKKDGSERKLCTLFVEEGARGQGHGTALLERACGWLGTDKPTATIAEERLGDFASIIERMRWVKTSELRSAYRQGKTEFVYNGTAEENGG